MRTAADRVGFMQGRLSPKIDEKIQAFPWPYWEAEMPLAKSIGLSLMEWTLDQARIDENPMMTHEGRYLIQHLAETNGIQIASLTGDCFMQAPFWKAQDEERDHLIALFLKVLESAAIMGMHCVVVPLVDHGTLSNLSERLLLEKTLLGFTDFLKRNHLFIVFESDFSPIKLKQFIEGFPKEAFGINFDMGNSASYGWDPEEEIGLLAKRIINVHVKDRVLGGTTVPLGDGAVNFAKVFAFLQQVNYSGNFILQTARASDGLHLEVLSQYQQFVIQCIEEAHGS